jgi:hypothetical protein
MLQSDEDRSQVYVHRNTCQIIRTGGGFRLDLYQPGFPDENIRLGKSVYELNIWIGNHRRLMALPQELAVFMADGG